MGCNLFKIIIEASHMTRYKIEEHLQPKNLYKGSVESQLKASKDIKKNWFMKQRFSMVLRIN